MCYKGTGSRKSFRSGNELKFTTGNPLATIVFSIRDGVNYFEM